LKGIILSAGQGRRLLPLTQELPKCLLRVGGHTVLEWQLRMLLAAGVGEAVVVTGFGAGAVERELGEMTPPGMRVRTLFNELYDRSDNLVSCALASGEMRQDFLLLNGDTLADPAVVARLLASPASPVAIAVARKPAYDDDDMKVRCAGTRVVRIGKNLGAAESNGEAIGFSLYRGRGPRLFTDALAEVLRQPDGSRRWYLSAVDLLAGRGEVHHVGVEGLRWAEIDYPNDLLAAYAVVGALRQGVNGHGADGAAANGHRLGAGGGHVAQPDVPLRERPLS
jgi:L-glutamine-phosphate cytidylyltransferase